MGPHHINMFLVDYMYIQGSLILDVLSILLISPVGFWGNMD